MGQTVWPHIILFFSSNYMAELKTSSPGFPARRDLMSQAKVALVYLGIVATFAVVSLIACVIWGC
jgi:hypothetical protein